MICGNDKQNVVVKLFERDMVMFNAEARTYAFLKNDFASPRCYGAFSGKGYGNTRIGANVLEELAVTFRRKADMTYQQRSVIVILLLERSCTDSSQLKPQRLRAFDIVSHLHDRGIHHGDPEPRNFGLREDGQLVIYDYSHATFTTDCDSTCCEELAFAKRLLLE